MPSRARRAQWTEGKVRVPVGTVHPTRGVPVGAGGDSSPNSVMAVDLRNKYALTLRLLAASGRLHWPWPVGETPSAGEVADAAQRTLPPLDRGGG